MSSNLAFSCFLGYSVSIEVPLRITSSEVGRSWLASGNSIILVNVKWSITSLPISWRSKSFQRDRLSLWLTPLVLGGHIDVKALLFCFSWHLSIIWKQSWVSTVWVWPSKSRVQWSTPTPRRLVREWVFSAVRNSSIWLLIAAYHSFELEVLVFEWVNLLHNVVKYSWLGVGSVNDATAWIIDHSIRERYTLPHLFTWSLKILLRDRSVRFV